MTPRLRTSLSARVPHTPADREHLDAMARAAWQKQGIFTVRVDEVAREMDRMFLTAMANEMLGERKW
jgi:hypothetical protein